MHPRKALPLAQTRRLQPSCGRCVVADLWCAPPVEGRRSPTFCLPGRRPTSGQPGARRARQVAEGAASGVGVTGARARRARASLWLERGTAATASCRDSRWRALQVAAERLLALSCSFPLIHARKPRKWRTRPPYILHIAESVQSPGPTVRQQAPTVVRQRSDSL